MEKNDKEIIITSNKIDKHDGYDYELYTTTGVANMKLEPGGTFSCDWRDNHNTIFRKGFKFDLTKTHNQLGNVTIDYQCDYHPNFEPNGTSYLTVYGWSVDPMIEFYIVESWGIWRPPGEEPVGTIEVDGGTYDVYNCLRVEKPSIRGTQTFRVYWSVRRERKTEGHISVSQHFREWEKLGLHLGKMYEISLSVEGYQSSGYAHVTKNDIKFL